MGPKGVQPSWSRQNLIFERTRMYSLYNPYSIYFRMVMILWTLDSESYKSLSLGKGSQGNPIRPNKAQQSLIVPHGPCGVALAPLA